MDLRLCACGLFPCRGRQAPDRPRLELARGPGRALPGPAWRRHSLCAPRRADRSLRHRPAPGQGVWARRDRRQSRRLSRAAACGLSARLPCRRNAGHQNQFQALAQGLLALPAGHRPVRSRQFQQCFFNLADAGYRRLPRSNHSHLCGVQPGGRLDFLSGRTSIRRLWAEDDPARGVHGLLADLSRLCANGKHSAHSLALHPLWGVSGDFPLGWQGARHGPRAGAAPRQRHRLLQRDHRIAGARGERRRSHAAVFLYGAVFAVVGSIALLPADAKVS
jgi:hypothetical protein